MYQHFWILAFGGAGIPILLTFSYSPCAGWRVFHFLLSWTHTSFIGLSQLCHSHYPVPYFTVHASIHVTPVKLPCSVRVHYIIQNDDFISSFPTLEYPSTRQCTIGFFAHTTSIPAYRWLLWDLFWFQDVV